MTTGETQSLDTSSPNPTPPSADKRYAELVRRVKAARLLDRRPGIYAARIVCSGAMFASGWVAFALTGDSWWQLIVALFLAISYTQVGFIAHDAGHRQVFRNPKLNNALLLVSANAGIGIAAGWWFRNHNRHHAHPNNTEFDPDVNLRIFAYSHEQGEKKAGVDRFVSRHQHLLYFPLLSFLGFSLHIESVLVVLRNGVKHRWIEGSLLLGHFLAYVIAVAIVLPPSKAFAFVLLHQLVFGLYLGSTFAPNHKGMEMFSKDDEPTFLERQVRSSRNVRGGAVMSYILGGLNYQIEHHLFPSMPRPNLRKARTIVKSFCEEMELPYAERSLFGSFGDVTRHFRATRSA